MRGDLPAPSGSGGAPSATRRGVLVWAGAVLVSLGALLLAAPVLGPILGAIVRGGDPRRWVALDALDAYPEGEIRLATFRNPFRVPWDGSTADIPCWVRRVRGEHFQVFAINCTHLGCPVRWFPASGLFLCPCHGGVFYANGARAAGPPPRGLYEYETRVRGGRLWIRAGRIPVLSRPA